MNRYETLFIVQSELSSEDITAIVDRYSKIITDMKGTILKVERWGKRKLAYLIRKQSRGFYILIDFAGRREIVAEFERILKFDDKVLKYMSVKLADSITAEEIEKELAGVQKAEAPPANIIPAGGIPAASAPAASTPAEPKTESPQEEKI